MHSFIVRIYRKVCNTNRVVGTVEDVEHHRTLRFRSYRGLERAIRRALLEEDGDPPPGDRGSGPPPPDES